MSTNSPHWLTRLGLRQEQLDRLLVETDQRDITDAYPLAPLQAGVLFHSLAAADGGEYIFQSMHEIEGDLDTDIFIRAWQHIVDRHTILRSTFAWDGFDHPLQLVHRDTPAVVRNLDWTALQDSKKDAELKIVLSGERHRGFDLEHEVPSRIDLIKVARRRHWLVWHVHHLLIDECSMQIVFDEVLEAYSALRTGATPTLPEALPYRDHIDGLARRDAATDTDYWTDRLRGRKAPTSIPAVAPAGKGTSDVDFVELDLPASTAGRIENLCQENRIAVSSVLQAAWALVLGYHSGEHDVVFGTVRSGRSDDGRGTGRMVGPLETTLPARIVIDRAATVTDWLASVHENLVELGRHEHASLIDIRRCTAVPGDRQLFESLFITPPEFTARSAPDRAAELTLRPVLDYINTGYPLVISMRITETPRLQLTYDPARITRIAAERMLSCYRQSIESIALHSRAKVADLAHLPAEYSELVLERWNDTGVPVPLSQTILDLIGEKVIETPDAVAVSCGNSHLTYSQLYAAAKRLAERLHGEGVGVGDLVGVHLSRSVEMIIALLGIILAGAAYVPLDPTYPADRLSYMIDDSAAALVLTSREVGQISGGAVDVITIEDLALLTAVSPVSPAWPATPATPTAAPTTSPLPRPGPDDSVYTIYTSGSTGRPKGVDTSHGSLLDHLLSMARKLDAGTGDVWLAMTSLSFDPSALEIYLPLIMGARLIVVPENIIHDGDELLSLIRGGSITHVQATPSVWRMLLSTGFDEKSVVALSGGEPLSRQLARDLATRSRRLLNVYGPTETTIWSTIGAVSPSVTTVDVGRPLDNTRIYLLDESLTPVPIGAIGELYIGGAGVTQGYRHRPALTADRYRPDPFGPPGGRLYATGDRARYLDDGSIEVLGRVDNQVKILGHRIEPSEIEACLLAHHQIKEAVVVAREYAGARRLVAYLTTPDGERPMPTKLRLYLLGLLPRYMVPAAFVYLDRLPLTPNEKLDRSALPAPEGAKTITTPVKVRPRTPMERMLTDIWAEVLGHSAVSVRDNYFQLGGDSLSSIRIAAIARHAGLAVSPRAMFTHQTVAELAAVLDNSNDPADR